MRSGLVALAAAAALAFTSGAIEAHVAQFVPPAGHSGNETLPGVASSLEPGAPRLTRIPDAKLADRFHVVPSYQRPAHVKVVGAFAVEVPKHSHFLSAWSPGFLPVTLAFTDGRCFSLAADYVGGTLSNGRLNRASCERPHPAVAPTVSLPPGKSLQLVGSAWGYDAWYDPRSGTTSVTVPFSRTFQPFFTAHMPTSAMMAMSGPDWPGGNVTLVGKVDGRLTVVTLEVGY